MTTQRSYHSIAALTAFITEAVVLCGLDEGNSQLVAKILVEADRLGIKSHGVARLRAYCDELRAGRINTSPNVRLVRQGSATARVDGDNGLGFIVGEKCIGIAVEKAQVCGAGWVAAYNSNHFGIAGYYAATIASKGMIGFAMTNTPPLVAAFQGRGRMLGTNPMAVAFPTGDEFPVVIDMATSAISYGAVEIADRQKGPIPNDCAIDEVGRVTTDPGAVKGGGALLPLGGDRDHGGQKGYCLAAMVDILCGVLAGANWGPFVPPFLVEPLREYGNKGDGIGHLFGAIDVASLTDLKVFQGRLRDWSTCFRSGEPGVGFESVQIPGDPEWLAARKSLVSGIELDSPVVTDLVRLAKELGIQTTF